MGTGKSAIGRGIARILGGRHADTDREIEQRFGLPVTRIFQEHGEAAFRVAEADVLRGLVEQSMSGEGLLVVSTGGGTPLRPENAALLREIGSLIWLRASVDTILQRVLRKIDQRPLLAQYADDPRGRIESLLGEREPQYAALAAYVIDTSSFPSPDDAARSVVATLGLSEET
jgi:3-dehydroquinate synthase